MKNNFKTKESFPTLTVASYSEVFVCCHSSDVIGYCTLVITLINDKSPA